MTKREILRRLSSEYGATEVGKLLVLLFHACINELREKNDSAEMNDVLKNQGAIREMKLLLKDLNPREEQQQYDGAFGG